MALSASGVEGEALFVLRQRILRQVRVHEVWTRLPETVDGEHVVGAGSGGCRHLAADLVGCADNAHGRQPKCCAGESGVSAGMPVRCYGRVRIV